MILRAILLFSVLTVVATWPQAIRFSSIPDNVDAYFSLWRLGWIAHQLPSDPRHLFHANIFHPEQYTLAYSDAILVEGAAGMPFIRAGVPIVYVYNALVLGSFVAAGLGMFLLVRRLTGAALPATLAGLVFAFTPYRFDHYYHLELLWAAWMPLAFWMAHRTIESGRLRDGLGVGAFVALQILSSIYYGVFLCTALIVFVIPLLAGASAALRRRALVALAAGALLASAAVAPYMLPYRHTRAAIGERGGNEALLYGAGPRHYLAAMPENLLAGRLLGPLGRHEKRLFPGFIAIALGVLALWPPVSRTTIAYAVVLAIAINLSFGPRGLGYDWLRDLTVVYRGLRAPARFGQVALLAFAVLAALGCVRLRTWLTERGHRADAIVATLVVLAFVEYLVRPLTLTPVPTTAPPAYEWLRAQPPGVIAELPMPTKSNAPLHEGRFQFLSTFHWLPMVNGYSGNWTDAHVRRLEEFKGFPGEASIAALAAAGVSYVVVHERHYGREQYRQILDQLQGRAQVRQLARFDHDGFEVSIYSLLPSTFSLFPFPFQSTPGIPGGALTWDGGSGTHPPGRRYRCWTGRVYSRHGSYGAGGGTALVA